ncbi:fungal-specific transcription factor domain-containing protein [Ilyonectria destructans]|nr:fungal-specific transcription factor domain-containing protein [Ilyonectria destructans]
MPCSFLDHRDVYVHSNPSSASQPLIIQPQQPGGTTGSASPGQPSQITLGASFCKEASLEYFRVIHDKHHSIFHQPSFEENLQNDAVPEVILNAVVALGARFSKNLSVQPGDTRHQGDIYADKAHTQLDLRIVSLETIQACILLGTLCFVEGRTDSEAVYYAAAIRLALLMDLPRRPAANEIERQVNLRVWWSLYMIDIWSSTGLRLSRELTFPNDIDLPAEEGAFLCLTHSSEPVSAPSGIWAEMATLACLWAKIQDLNMASVNDGLHSHKLREAVDDLSSQLKQWKSSIPDFLVESLSNLDHYASLGLGSAFAALHLGYHYYSQVLFYQFLAGNDQSSSVPAEEYAKRCKEHAKGFCDLLYLSEDTRDSECIYVMVGHMLTITSTVYLHMLLFSSTDDEIPYARRRLEKNFETLTKLQRYWVMLDKTLNRLQVFHNACTQSIEQTFRMDRWMLKFILEYGRSMPERFAQPMVIQGDTPTWEVEETQIDNLQDWGFQVFNQAIGK